MCKSATTSSSKEWISSRRNWSMCRVRVVLDFGVRWRRIDNRLTSQSMKLRRLATIVGFSLFMATNAPDVRAETGYKAWLRYAPLEKASASKYETFPTNVVVAGDSV